MAEKSIDDWLDEAMDHYSRGNFADAESALQRVLDTSATEADALHLMGVVQLAKGDAQSAIHYLQRSVDAAPDEGEFYNNLGVALRAMQRWDESEASFRRATELAPTNA